MIIDKSCDPEFAAFKNAACAFINSGQLCVRNDYILVEHSIANDFMKHLKEKTDALCS